jgi:hypothetical protein
VTTTVASLLARAASQIGTYERTGNNDVLYADYYGITGYSWCYAFVQWCFEEDNARLPFTTMYVPAGVAWSRQNLQSVERGSPPQPGDIVHFTWSMSEWPPNRPGTGDHVGLVESWNGQDTLTTIEGNVGSPQGVYRMRRSINATLINYWRPVGTYSDSAAAPGPGPQPVQEDEDMGVQIGSDPNQGGDGSVYGVWGPQAWAFATDETRRLYEQFKLVQPGIMWMHPDNVQKLVIRGVIDGDTFNLQSPMPTNADLAGAVNAGRSESAQYSRDVQGNSNRNRDAVMANSNKLAAGIATGGTPAPPVLDKAASLKLATVAELLNEISARTKGAAAL